MSNHFENHWSNNGTVDTYTTSSQSSTRGYAANETHHESHSDTPNGSEHVVIHTTTTETHVEPQPKPAENNEIVSNGSAGRNDPTAADIANKGALSYRNRNNASSIFDGMVAAPEESPRKRGGIQNNAQESVQLEMLKLQREMTTANRLISNNIGDIAVSLNRTATTMESLASSQAIIADKLDKMGKSSGPNMLLRNLGAPALYPATTQGTSMYERQQVQPKQSKYNTTPSTPSEEVQGKSATQPWAGAVPRHADGNPLTGEGYGPRDGTGIGALRQHSKVPPGGFTSDFWRE